MEQEYIKCITNPVYFIENCCLSNDKSIKLTDKQKEFIEYNTSKSAQHPTSEGENVR